MTFGVGVELERGTFSIFRIAWGFRGWTCSVGTWFPTIRGVPWSGAHVFRTQGRLGVELLGLLTLPAFPVGRGHD